MTDSQKNSLLVVVVVILAYCTVPAFCFTQDLQHYTTEFAKRSYALTELFHSDSWLMRMGGPVFTSVTFFVALYQFSRMLVSYIPFLGDLLGMGLPLLGQIPTEMMTARDGENREQRVLNQLEHQVKSSVNRGQQQYELKK